MEALKEESGTGAKKLHSILVQSPLLSAAGFAKGKAFPERKWQTS